MTPSEASRAVTAPEAEPDVARVCEVLSERFGAAFSVWEYQGALKLVKGPITTPGPETFDLRAIPPELMAKVAESRDEPVVAPLPDGRYLLAMTAGYTNRKTYVAAAALTLQTNDLLKRLAAAAANQAQLEHSLRASRQLADSYARQVSLDFEELTWLRDLAKYLEFCDVTSGRDDVAENVLPPLRQVVQAEALVALPATGSESPSNRTAPLVGEPIVWTGKRLIDDATCCRLVTSVVQEVGIRPIVSNAARRNGFCEALDGVNSFILVPAVKSGTCTGWLLALNRIPQEPADGWRPLPRTVCSENEFGTIEANLIAAAAVMLATHAWNRELYEEKESLLVGVIRTLVNAMDAKDSYTCGHSDRVALMVRRLGQEMQLSIQDCEKLYMTGLLHDVGKIGVPDEVLTKPGRLTDEEFDLIKQHPVIGHRILRHLTQLSYALPGVLYHHEAIDGSGYPEGLMGEQIPLCARILAVVDAFDAMTSCRPYRDAMPVHKAETILREGAGRQWDAPTVDAFFRARSDIQKIRRKSYAHTQAVLRLRENGPTDVRDSASDPIVSAVSGTRH